MTRLLALAPQHANAMAIYAEAARICALKNAFLLVDTLSERAGLLLTKLQAKPTDPGGDLAKASEGFVPNAPLSQPAKDALMAVAATARNNPATLASQIDIVAGVLAATGPGVAVQIDSMAGETVISGNTIDGAVCFVGVPDPKANAKDLYAAFHGQAALVTVAVRVVIQVTPTQAVLRLHDNRLGRITVGGKALQDAAAPRPITGNTAVVGRQLNAVFDKVIAHDNILRGDGSVLMARQLALRDNFFDIPGGVALLVGAQATCIGNWGLGEASVLFCAVNTMMPPDPALLKSLNASLTLA